MKMKSILTALFVAFSISACSTVQKVVYRIDVPQGNYLEEAKVKQLKEGMTSEQVQYLLGTPVLRSPFASSTWYYVFLQQRSYQLPEQHTLLVNFNQNGVVESYHLDKPLLNSDKQAVNNAIIEVAPSDKSWWKF